jgi:hypothetical protein
MQQRFTVNTRDIIACNPRTLKSSLFDQNQCKIVPAAIGFFLGVNLKTIVSGCSENINTTSLHHGSDPIFCFLGFLKITRTSTFSGRSGCAGLGFSSRTRWKRCQSKCLVETHLICLSFQANGGICQFHSFWPV